MPTYEYVCEKCGDQFEKFQPITDAALSSCPKDRCRQKRWGKGKVKRVIGAGGGLIFKGTGFYITDYRSDKYKEAARKDTSVSPSASKSAGSGDAKTAAKPPPKPAASTGKA